MVRILDFRTTVVAATLLTYAIHIIARRKERNDDGTNDKGHVYRLD